MAAGAIIGGKWGRIMSYHNDLVLLSSFAVFAYRDLWPFATYTENPADGSEGSILWVKIAILALISVGVFLFIPRQYVPVDPKVGYQCSSQERITDSVLEPCGDPKSRANCFHIFKTGLFIYGPYRIRGLSSSSSFPYPNTSIG